MKIKNLFRPTYYLYWNNGRKQGAIIKVNFLGYETPVAWGSELAIKALMNFPNSDVILDNIYD